MVYNVDRFTRSLGDFAKIVEVFDAHGVEGAAGLPIGLQIVGHPFDDAGVLRIAQAYEQATDWHTRHPELSGG